MSKQKFIILATFFPVPGTWRCSFGFDYASAIQRSGEYDVVIIRPDGVEDYVYHGIPVYSFKAKALSRYGIFDYILFKQNQREFIRTIDRIGISPNDVAVCEAYNEDLGFYGWALKKLNPNILTALHHHSLGSFGIMNGPHCYHWPIKVVNFLWMRYIHEHQDIHIFISKLCETSFRRFPDTSWSQYEPYVTIGRGLWLFRSARIKNSYILHNGVDTRIFCKGERKLSNKFRIGCVANFNKVKDQITLVRALELISGDLGDWELLFVGSGQDKDFVVEFVERHGLSDKVVFLGEVEHERLAEFYRNIDLFVLPSYFEGFGCVYAESWSCGTPFIACTHSGIADLLECPNESDWLIKPRDHKELARKIVRYYEKRDKQNLVGEVSIDVLVPRFLHYVGQLRNKVQ